MAKKKANDEEEADATDGGAKRKTLVMMAVAGVVLSLAGGGGYWWMQRAKTAQAAKEAAAAANPARKPTAFLDLPEMTINLAAGGNDRQQFLRMKVALELSEQKVAQEISPLVPRVVDSFQVFMRELRASDLEGSAGLYRMREELTRRVNVAVYPAKVEAVLFKELMVQ
jgi:flagellar protein FliL